MRLKTLELSGFKSFPRTTTLSFKAPVSAIVGPNGSGKSNIAEAFRFVLGEQSMKSLRGQRGEDLIFNGSAKQGRQNRAAVKVVLDNQDRLFNIDFDEVILGRTVHRDGVNEYFINDSPVRLKDIRELISRASIGASGHHIISQGETDKMIDASPEERKEMVEDALGLRSYQIQRLDSIRKLERTRQNIQEVQGQRRETAPRLRELRREKEKIDRGRQLKEELAEAAKRYFAAEDQRIRTAREEAQNHHRELQNQKTELENRLQKTVAQTREPAESEGGNSERDRVIQEISQLDAELETLTRDLGRLEGVISASEKVITKQAEAENSNQSRTVYLVHVEDTARYIEEQIETAEEQAEQEAIRLAFSNIRESLRHFIRVNREEPDDAAVQEARKVIESSRREQEEMEARRAKLRQARQAKEEAYQQLLAEADRQKSARLEAKRLEYELQSQLREISGRLERAAAAIRTAERDQETMNQDLSAVGQHIGRTVMEYRDQRDAALAAGQSIEDPPARKDLERLMIRIEDSTVENSREILREYEELTEQDQFLERELKDLEASAASLEELIKELEATLEREFSQGLKRVNREFQKLFSHMFAGGTAKLVRSPSAAPESTEKEQDPSDRPAAAYSATEGLELSVNPPHKKIKGLRMLSGGERSLVSVALLFALSLINPPPFIILDETDAALDEANAKKYSDLVEELAERSQLVIITHNRETMSRAGVLYGVTMGASGASSILSVAFEEAKEAVDKISNS